MYLKNIYALCNENKLEQTLMHMYSRKNKYAFCNENKLEHTLMHMYSRKNKYALGTIHKRRLFGGVGR